MKLLGLKCMGFEQKRACACGAAFTHRQRAGSPATQLVQRVFVDFQSGCNVQTSTTRELHVMCGGTCVYRRLEQETSL
jgi:hypothetical protein